MISRLYSKGCSGSHHSKAERGHRIRLYLIKKYLEVMKGNITLYSKEGQGTSFVVTLPISDKAIQSHKEIPTTDSGKPKVLIVEDNLQISNFLIDVIKMITRISLQRMVAPDLLSQLHSRPTLLLWMR